MANQGIYESGMDWSQFSIVEGVGEVLVAESWDEKAGLNVTKEFHRLLREKLQNAKAKADFITRRLAQMGMFTKPLDYATKTPLLELYPPTLQPLLGDPNLGQWQETPPFIGIFDQLDQLEGSPRTVIHPAVAQVVIETALALQLLVQQGGEKIILPPDRFATNFRNQNIPLIRGPIN